MPVKKSGTHSLTTTARARKPSSKSSAGSNGRPGKAAVPSRPKKSPAMHKYTTAKVVLIGGAVTGKSALFWRLASNPFSPAIPNQMQHVVLSTLRTERGDGTVCEPVLWDLPGHPDHQLVHALLLEDTDLALVVYDPTGQPSPLHPAEYWLKVLTRRNKPCLAILVAGRVDRGRGALTAEEVKEFCKSYKVAGDCISTSALTGEGLDALIDRIRTNIAWDKKEAAVVTTTFEWIKEGILGLKENPRLRKVLLTPAELEKKLRDKDGRRAFDRDELMKAVRQLANMGVLMVLRGASGDESILVKPDLLVELAKNFVDEARRNRRGLGALSLQRMHDGEYHFPAIEHLKKEEQEILLTATSVLFIESSVCFTAIAGDETYLIFPALIRQKKPQTGEVETEEDATYVIKGAVESIYSVLVVLLGYTRIFRRTNQWENEAQYEFPTQVVCGFRQIAEREGEMQLVLYYGQGAGEEERKLFEASIEIFLKSRDVTAIKFPAVYCTNPDCNYRQERTAVMRRRAEGRDFIRCDECGERIALERGGKSVSLDSANKRLMESEKKRAARQPKFKATLVRLRGLNMYKEGAALRPRCFISYAWGVEKDEAWVRTLAKDLDEAGVDAVIDARDNADLGASISRFVDSIEDHDHVVVIGTPLYLEKYKGNEEGKGSVLAAEMEVISIRLLGNEERKKTVVPLLLRGTEDSSLPAILRGGVRVDFRKDEDYFPSLFRLLVNLYSMSPADPEVEALIKDMDMQT